MVWSENIVAAQSSFMMTTVQARRSGFAEFAKVRFPVVRPLARPAAGGRPSSAVFL
jgi:hypothetical protein